MSKPWLIHFFRRHPDDDPDALVPVIDFLERVPAKAVAEIQAVLEAVAEAPPPAFSDATHEPDSDPCVVDDQRTRRRSTSAIRSHVCLQMRRCVSEPTRPASRHRR
jgi:hypothetical protein